MSTPITALHINGQSRKFQADGERSLLSVLRDDLDLTGAKYGCGEGRCGACTVLVDGLPTRSCVMTVKSAAGKKITTIEGLEENGKLHPVQEAFIKAEALQCGYCTPGMIMSAVALLRKNANPSRAEIIEAMDGNICRCGVYQRLIAAVAAAAKSTK